MRASSSVLSSEARASAAARRVSVCVRSDFSVSHCASASNQIANLSSVCTARTSWLVHTPKRDRKRFTRSDLLGPSATELFASPCHTCATVMSNARGDALFALV